MIDGDFAVAGERCAALTPPEQALASAIAEARVRAMRWVMSDLPWDQVSMDSPSARSSGRRWARPTSAYCTGRWPRVRRLQASARSSSDEPSDRIFGGQSQRPKRPGVKSYAVATRCARPLRASRTKGFARAR